MGLLCPHLERVVLPCCFTRSCASFSFSIGPDLGQQKKKLEEEQEQEQDSSNQVAAATANCIISAKEEEN
jgi:hypothetical protein